MSDNADCKEMTKRRLDELLTHWIDDFGYKRTSTWEMNEAVAIAKAAIDVLPYDDELTVKINTHGNSLPVQHGEWIDLTTANDVKMHKGEYMVISLGVSMELPKGYYAKVVPRSSTCAKWGIMMANSIGIIENSYAGDNDIWGFPAYAIRDTFIPKGTRVCQFCVCKQEAGVMFAVVDHLGNADRGGYGSTGD